MIVLVCPEGQCRYVEGNLRAYKRVMWVKKLLDEIGIDGNRLSLVNLSSEDKEDASVSYMYQMRVSGPYAYSHTRLIE